MERPDTGKNGHGIKKEEGKEGMSRRGCEECLYIITNPTRTRTAVKKHLKSKNIAKARPITWRETKKEKKNRRYRQMAYFAGTNGREENNNDILKLDKTYLGEEELSFVSFS